MIKKNSLFYLKRQYFIPLFAINVLFSYQSQLSALTISGYIKEKGNGKEISDATIFDDAKRTEFVNTDEKGYFKINLDNQSQFVIIRSENYYDKKINISELKSSQDNKIYLELLPDILGSGIIRAKRKQEISQTNLSQAELRYTAGSGGDAVKAIQTLPSVSPSSVGSANIVVRGGDPGDNKYFYDDLSLPFVFHFGGVNTVIPTKMIDSVDFYPGGFSALYSDATGGIIQLNSKNSIPERFSGDIEAGLFQSGIYLEGNTKVTNSNSSSNNEDNKIGYRVGIRRTFYELYKPIFDNINNIDFYTFPQSTDYQFILNGNVTDGTWQAYLMGASDKLGLLSNNGDSENSSGKNSFDFANYYETTGIKYSKNLGNGYGVQSTFQQLYNTVRIKTSSNNLDIKAYTYSIKTSVTKNFNENNFLTVGIKPNYEIVNINFDIPQIPAPGSGSQTYDPFTAPKIKDEQSITSIYGNIFADLNLKPIKNLLINPGINILQGRYHKQIEIDPRLGARYEFLPKQTLKGAIGYYSERPQPQFNASNYGNPNLELERTKQYVLGYETKLFSDWALDIQGWYKSSNNLVGPAINQPSLKYENSIKQEAKGLDFFLKKDFIGRIYGWVSYSYSQSKKQDPASQIWRYSDYDRTNNINFVANAKVTNRWLLGTRIQYMSGTPYSSVDGGVFNQNTGQYEPQSDGQTYYINKNNVRFPSFFQADIRSDYDFLFDNWKLDLYLEINNVTNQKNIAQINYSRDYSEKTNVYSFPILPSIGVIASF
jgi:hypothetical protein